MTTDSSTGDSARVHKDYYTALCSAALSFSSSLELKEVLQNVVTNVTETMKVKACSLRLYDSRTGQLQLSAAHGLSSSYLAKGPVDIQHSAIDSDALAGETVIIQDVRTDTRFQYAQAAIREGIVSILCVPLEVHGEAIGVMRVYTGEPCTFHQDDIQFLSVLARLAALSIENANLYESVRNSYDGVMEVLWGSSLQPADN
ncbi:MAG TPA: GAF domain-containing protein [Ktedonobacteraceae bacterium]|nr:GAF domain-containing protein [Ktedonobacteraceae bacterium]